MSSSTSVSSDEHAVDTVEGIAYPTMPAPYYVPVFPPHYPQPCGPPAVSPGDYNWVAPFPLLGTMPDPQPSAYYDGAPYGLPYPHGPGYIWYYSPSTQVSSGFSRKRPAPTGEYDVADGVKRLKHEVDRRVAGCCEGKNFIHAHMESTQHRMNLSSEEQNKLTWYYCSDFGKGCNHYHGRKNAIEQHSCVKKGTAMTLERVGLPVIVRLDGPQVTWGIPPENGDPQPLTLTPPPPPPDQKSRHATTASHNFVHSSQPAEPVISSPTSNSHSMLPSSTPPASTVGTVGPSTPNLAEQDTPLVLDDLLPKIFIIDLVLRLNMDKDDVFIATISPELAHIMELVRAELGRNTTVPSTIASSPDPTAQDTSFGKL